MKVENGKYYVGEYDNGEYIEKNIMYVLSVREGNATEVDSIFYETETVYIEDGKFNSIFKNDWLPEFIKREATKEEIEIFNKHRQDTPELKHYAETMTGIWLKSK